MPAVLVVEDDADARRLIQRWLDQEGYRVDEVCDAESALEQLGRGSYDLVVLDVVLPGMDGYELARRLRSQATHAPPVLLCSIIEADDIPAEFSDSPWLAKPFARGELVNAVRTALAREDCNA
ncbi:MAG: response regulator [Actinomycetota bacterium]|nr:response regulator [Actinomycetota bacterium]